ncbi:MAG TPA: 3-phosphoshikimate 1-carboxyvinyltransferase [Bacillota bacterium]
MKRDRPEAAADVRPRTARIRPPAEPPDVAVPVPGSKSVSNRALLLASLAAGNSDLQGVLFADDTEHMLECLRRLGIAVAADREAARVRLEGSGGQWPVRRADLFAGNAGTVARFLAAALCLGRGPYRIDGSPRMRRRPIGPLLAALRDLGAEAIDEHGSGCPPIRVGGPLLGGTARLDAAQSSQFLSALLLVLPLAPSDSRIVPVGGVPARPYVDMTVRMAAGFGVEPPSQDGGDWLIRGGQSYRGRDYTVEPDASSASYFLAAAALTGGRVTVPGIGRGSLQGDAAFVDILAAMGCRVEQGDDATTVSGPADGRLRAVDVDLNTMSDLTPTLAVLAPFADGPVRIRNVGHIRVQESDRLRALATELARVGIGVEEVAHGLTIHPGHPRPGRVRTYDDHRLAMAFSLLALRVPGMEIDDPACAAKTFPDFYRRLERLGARVQLY